MRHSLASRARAAAGPPGAGHPGARAAAKLRVGFVLMHNFTLTAFSSFVDVLRLAADEGDRSRPIGCSWQVMSPGRRPARSSCGIDIQPTSDLADPEAFDYIVVVGGLLHGMPPLPPAVAQWLRRAAAAKVTLVGVCTGSFVLCRLGLMAQRKCCVSWYHYRDFLEEFPTLVPVADRLFVVDGDRITCSGGAGVADLAAQIVTQHLGSAVAQKALNILLIDRPRTAESAQPAPSLGEGRAGRPGRGAGEGAGEGGAQGAGQGRLGEGGIDDARVSRALLLMEQNLAEPLPIAALADALALSPRQLERLFAERLGESPQESYLALRLRHARWMLANTAFSAARIAADLGFADGSHFGRAFKARFGETPAAFRRAAAPSARRAGPAEETRVFD